MVVMTERGKLEKIYAFYRAKRRMPSYREAAELLGLSVESAVRVVRKFIDEGVLAKDAKGKILPVRGRNDVKLLGLVEAGFPSAAEEELLDTLSLEEYLIPNKDASFILKVKGDSMWDAGIREGDMVVVERGPTPKPGDIVIARIDGDFTMKYYRRSTKLVAGRKVEVVYLEAANKKYPPLYPKEDLRVEAIVRAVLRKY